MSAPDSLRIALVEDNQSDAFLIEHALHRRGIRFQLEHHTCGDEALQHWLPASGPTPDLILLDLNLPGMEGHEILRVLRSIPRMKDVPVVIVTGADLARIRLTDLAGSSRLIQKSMDLDSYLAAVGNAVIDLFPLRAQPVSTNGRN